LRDGERGEGHDSESKRENRSRSASVDEEVDRRTFSRSKDESKSTDRRRSRSKSVDDEREYGKEKYETRKDRQKRREKRRSRSVSVERESRSRDKSSRHREYRVKDKRRRRSRSKSLEGKEQQKDDIEEKNKEKSNKENRKQAKSDDDNSGCEKNITRVGGDSTPVTVTCGKKEGSECDGGQIIKPAIDFDRSDIATENSKRTVCDPKNLAENRCGGDLQGSDDEEGNATLTCTFTLCSLCLGKLL